MSKNNQLNIVVPEQSSPMIYAYSIKDNNKFDGLLKVGYTTRDVETRVNEQINIGMPGDLTIHKIEYREAAIRENGSTFTDKDVHKILKKQNFHAGNEWFRCSIEDVKAAVLSVKLNKDIEFSRNRNFSMRPEQIEAVKRTSEYFRNNSISKTKRTPKFLWNAKMRFGKTFGSYKLAQEMGFKKVLVLTFKPSVLAAWEEDLKTHIDFSDWKFYYAKDFTTDTIFEKDANFVCFGSFQDILGKDEKGKIKPKNEKIHETNWDLVIFDEYHYGAWRDTAKGIFEDDEEEELRKTYDSIQNGLDDSDINEDFIKITTDNYLFMSGTPFRSINSGEFIEDQVYNWSYTDEQRAKSSCTLNPNPYLSLPRMIMYTYELPSELNEITAGGQYNEFDLNKFFEAKGAGDSARFTNENKVQQWLDYLRSAHNPTSTDELKISGEKPMMPFSDVSLLKNLNHTVWFLPSVASCHAMANLLSLPNNTFYSDRKVVVAAGKKAGTGAEALKPVFKAMEPSPLETKTITLTCGKLLTGSTIMPWTGIFMLCNLSSPETYFQAAFRVQSPWVVDSEINDDKIILKHDCFVFDFAIHRALTMVSEYSRKTSSESDPEKRVSEFTNYLPIIAYDGSSLKQLNESDILDYTLSGTTASLLAKRFESSLLVNVDNATLSRVSSNEKAMQAIDKILDFRNMKNREVFKAVINDSDEIKQAKADGKTETKNGKKLTEQEKEIKKVRKEIQDKLKKFATRIPVFMYLTDYREKSVVDIIRCFEPELFEEVSGLTVEDFELLLSLNLFNGLVMEDAILKFKRYEDSSLEYTGIRKNNNLVIGGFDTTISKEDHDRLY